VKPLLEEQAPIEYQGRAGVSAFARNSDGIMAQQDGIDSIPID